MNHCAGQTLHPSCICRNSCRYIALRSGSTAIQSEGVGMACVRARANIRVWRCSASGSAATKCKGQTQRSRCHTFRHPPSMRASNAVQVGLCTCSIPPTSNTLTTDGPFGGQRSQCSTGRTTKGPGATCGQSGLVPSFLLSVTPNVRPLSNRSL